VRFSVSLPADERVRAGVLAVPADAWQPAVDAGGQPRPGAEVAELHTLELAGWPEGTRAICRREDPHPGAQLTFTDVDGHRFQVFITDQPDPDVTMLELRHRARVEDRIRCGKATGLRNLPFDLLRRNQVWLELVLAAQDLCCWAQVLLLEGDLKVAEPKTLRYRLLHVAARVVRHARRLIVRLQRTWPWPPHWPPRSRVCAHCRCAADRPSAHQPDRSPTSGLHDHAHAGQTAAPGSTETTQNPAPSSQPPHPGRHHPRNCPLPPSRERLMKSRG
jgi:hypothetical protein